MVRIFLGFLAVVIFFNGCNTGAKERRERHKGSQPQTGLIYKGNMDGCMEVYDELWCPKEYADKGSLASGDKSNLYFKDENGSFVILNRENMSKAKGKRLYTKDEFRVFRKVRDKNITK